MFVKGYSVDCRTGWGLLMDTFIVHVSYFNNSNLFDSRSVQVGL